MTNKLSSLGIMFRHTNMPLKEVLSKSGKTFLKPLTLRLKGKTTAFIVASMEPRRVIDRSEMIIEIDAIGVKQFISGTIRHHAMVELLLKSFVSNAVEFTHRYYNNYNVPNIKLIVVFKYRTDSQASEEDLEKAELSVILSDIGFRFDSEESQRYITFSTPWREKEMFTTAVLSKYIICDEDSYVG